jgi:hypothetical protein
MRKPELRQASRLTSTHQDPISPKQVIHALTTSSDSYRGAYHTPDQGASREDPNVLVKFGTRLTRGQIARIQGLVKEHHARNPSAAALKKEEVVRFAIDHLLTQKDPLALISNNRR